MNNTCHASLTYFCVVKKHLGNGTMAFFAALIFWVAIGSVFSYTPTKIQRHSVHQGGDELKSQSAPSLILSDQSYSIALKTEVGGNVLLKIWPFEALAVWEDAKRFELTTAAQKPRAHQKPYLQHIRRLLFPNHSFS